MKPIYKLIADVLIDYERMCQPYPFAILTRDMGQKIKEFDKDFDLIEYQYYIARRDERKENNGSSE